MNSKQKRVQPSLSKRDRQIPRQYLIGITILLLGSLFLGSCQPQPGLASLPPTPTSVVLQDTTDQADIPAYTPLPTRPPYNPGELVDYIAQPGDTLVALAAHFNTTREEILAANPFIPLSATTMPPGMPMKIPIYYVPFWGSPYQILPDGLFINGPAQVGFNTNQFVAEHPGWLRDYTEYAYDGKRSGAEIVDAVALNFSLSPRLLLALLEYQSAALSQPNQPEHLRQYPLGIQDRSHTGLYLQLIAAADMLNNAYYSWRIGKLTSFEHMDGRLERPDPWQNAATVALQLFFSRMVDYPAYSVAISQDGVAQVYRNLFGDPWAVDTAHIPGSLAQPDFALPFEPELVWALTGGPHTAWGQGEPLAALDFAPGALKGGCTPSEEWATAVAPGVVTRSELGTVVMDLDEDGDERTGWVMFYFHIGTEKRAPVGARLKTGDPVGHPSCEGGRTTGTHIHIARKYNGEWIPADGPLAFNLEGWIAQNGDQPYQGSLERGGDIIIACTCSDYKSQLSARQR